MQQLVEKESSKPSNVEIQVDEKTSKSDPISNTNPENDINKIRETQITTIPHRHPNHRSRQLDQATYSEQNQQANIPKNTNVGAIHSCDNKSSQVSSLGKIPQKIDLGWSDPFSVRQFVFHLEDHINLYRQGSLPRDGKTFVAGEEIKAFHQQALRTNIF